MTFSFVRNPYTRLYSAYKFLKNGGYDVDDKLWFDTHIACYKNFEDFVLNWLNPRNIWQKNHFYPQSYFLCDKKSIKVDFLGKIESIDSDFKQLCKIVDLDANHCHKNKTPKKDNFSDVTNSQINDKIFITYKEDFKNFDYNKI